MNIALVGYGKMGKTIEQILEARGHHISFKISKENAHLLAEIKPQNTDVAIEFTGPESAFQNLQMLMQQGIRTVSGSTGWKEHLPTIEALCIEKKLGFIWASNFSVGVNLFFELNNKLAQLMKNHPEYLPAIEEIHHTQKKDAPSGTAITLAEPILASNHRFDGWDLSEKAKNNELKITAIRQDPAPGTHTVSYRSAVDDIEIKHTAHSRDGFALGAVLAAEFLAKKSGIFEMKDVLFS